MASAEGTAVRWVASKKRASSRMGGANGSGDKQVLLCARRDGRDAVGYAEGRGEATPPHWMYDAEADGKKRWRYYCGICRY